MIKVSEFLIVLCAASLPVTYVLLMRHYLLKNEAEDLANLAIANLAKAGPLEAHECCCETAGKALTGKSEAKEAIAA